MSETDDIVERLNRHRCVTGIRTVIDDAADEIERLRAERDEARREIVLLLNGCCSWSKLTQEIKKRGWDCFKESK